MRYKFVDKTQWHWWFAWYPVLTECGEYIWLEDVRRCKTYYDDYDVDGLKYEASKWRYA